MKDYVTGIECNWPYTGPPRAIGPEQRVWYHILRDTRRHVYDWPQGQYRPASTHAEALEKFGFRVTSGGGR